MKINYYLIYFCGSGFPAAIRTISVTLNRGWKAAPTCLSTPVSL